MSRGGIGNIERSGTATGPQFDADNVPEVPILLLGDAEVGKSTFLSRLSLGRPKDSTAPGTPPPYELPRLRDLDQPFTFDIKLYNRPYRFCFYDTASPTSYATLRPAFIILCFDISRRHTLESLVKHWKSMVETHFNYDEMLPVMVLGLKRDKRKEWREDLPGERPGAGKESIMPQEGLRIAQEMRCDRYAECSALTGELCREVLEDVARTAARTTTEKGAKMEGGCIVM